MPCRRLYALPRRRPLQRGRFPLRCLPAASSPAIMPLKSEISPIPLMRKLADAGLARTAGCSRRGKPLVMRVLRLASHCLGCLGYPGTQAGCARGVSGSFFVPLLASTVAGIRIGYGEGTTTCTIAALRADSQCSRRDRLCRAGAEKVPDGPARRCRLDMVVTEREVIAFARGLDPCGILFLGDVVGRSRPQSCRRARCRT